VVTVNSQGVVTGLKEGNATITATTKDGGKTAKCTVTVKYLPNVVTGVTLNKDNITLNLNESSTLIANVNPSNANNKKVSWTSDNPSVATVNSSGVVTGIKTGIATIKVTTLDGNKTATCKVKVGTKLIFIGDSRVNRLAGYDGKYSINYRGRDKVFIEKGGTKHSDWFSSNSSLMNKVDVTVSKLGGVRCAIIIGLAGNDLNITTASSVSEGRQKIISLTEKYNTSLVDLAHKYNNLCTIYFTSVNPVQLNKKYTVYSYDSTSALTKKGRSNSKIETFNNSIKNLILQDNITNLKYVDTSSYFVEYKDKLKNGYNTSDGTHYNEKTAQLVYDKILELTGL
jgi:lysophospholipase L1-like esterase